ncbi:MAG: ABC transporter ATP-binding protein, partial [Gammaproteobacteria bacterium]|nr:ABC transporter ATP-binding protein [Gammaproteobacteria bacterium]
MKSLLRLLPYLKPYKGQIIVGFVGFFGARFFEISTYFFVSQGIDAIGEKLSQLPPAVSYSIAQIAMFIVGTVALRFVFVVQARRAFRRVGQQISFDLREQLFAAVQQQGSDFFSRIGVGDIMTRAIQDIALVQRLIAFGLIQVVIMIYAPLFGLSAMFMKSMSLTLLILPLLPLIYIYAQWVATQMAVTSKIVQESLSELAAHTQENLSGIRTIQAQAQEENEIKRFYQTNDGYARAFYDQARIGSLMSAWMPWLTALSQLTVIVYGGHLVLTGALTVGDLIFFLACLNMLLQPIRMAGFFITLVARAGVGVDRLCEIFDAPAEITDQPSGRALANIQGRFVIRDLSYSYPSSSQPVLSNINMTINAGESIGIVGRVGSGKSTLLKQFTRMLDTPPGALFLDDVDVREYPLAQLRSQVAQVLQDPFL